LDNGPEFISVKLAGWAGEHGVTLELLKNGKPMQNGFIERLYRSYRQAVLDMFVFLKPGGRLDVTKGPPLTSSEEHEYG
jgi:transposase InsO family protein